MEQVVNKIGKLCLDDLDNSWVEAIYFSEYLEYGEIPAEYASILKRIKIQPIFRSIMKAVESWLSTETDDNDTEKTWATLSRQFQSRNLLAILGYNIHEGTKNVMNEKLRSKALISARLYFKLLSIPGFMAYNIYHSQLFAHSLACVGFPKIICDKYDERSKSKDDKGKENRITNMQELREQVNFLIKQLQLFVIDLRAIIEQLQLGPNDMNFEEILNNLVEVTGGAIVNKLNVGKKYSRLSLNVLLQCLKSYPY